MPYAKHRTRAVFQDPSGRRARIVKRVMRTVGIISTMFGAALIAGLLIPPLLPKVAITDDSLSLRRLPQFLGSRAARERVAARRRLFAALTGQPAAPALRTQVLPLRPPPAADPARPRGSITAGFYVNWDDNSFVS